jgi:hypothetical protein
MAQMQSRAMRLAAGLIVALIPALAHDMARSESKIQIRDREVRAALTLNLLEFHDPVLHFDPTGHMTVDDLDRDIGVIYDSVKRHYIVRGTDAPVRTTLERYVLIDGHAVHLDILYVFEHAVSSLDVTSTLYQVMAPDHQHLLTVMLNGTLHEGVLNASSPRAVFTGIATTRLETMWKFVRLGVEHIFTGYDHLAFLLGLLVATATLGSLIRIITSFTVAHSITLALATFNVVILPSRLTESVIALSIFYVAAENLLDFRVMKRYYVTFLFGLVHGFGFSNVLRDMDLPRSSLALSLFSFNLGVEIGQVTFVLLIFPLVQDLVRSGWRRLQPTVSICIGVLAVYWFVQRVFPG